MVGELAASSATVRHRAKPSSRPSTSTNRPATPGEAGFGHVPPRPRTLAQGFEGLMVERGGTVQIERSDRPEDEAVAHFIRPCGACHPAR